MGIVANFTRFPAVQKFWKSVKIWPSYREFKGGNFFETQCRRLAVQHMCAMFEGLTRFCFVFRFGFRTTLLDFTSRIERLHFCYYYADVWRVLAYFCNKYSCAHPGQIRSSTVCVCRRFHEAHGRAVVRAQPWPLRQGYFSHAVHGCVTH